MVVKVQTEIILHQLLISSNLKTGSVDLSNVNALPYYPANRWYIRRTQSRCILSLRLETNQPYGRLFMNNQPNGRLRAIWNLHIKPLTSNWHNAKDACTRTRTRAGEKRTE